ncbi:uncharacterized protein [Miscanthus floridulus]|uniref:uncharacterized protein n=1 Tax=Miscanthus floridulus TaxID=154761 RepID=UPI00345B37F6
MPLATQQAQMMHSHVITIPALLHGTRCYVDASIKPDQQNSNPRPAGLGVFILNFQEQTPQAIYVKARLGDCSSVIMAEAASLVLASAVGHNLNLSGVNFLSDYEQLVHFLNKNDISNPPDWRIKYHTQTFANFTRSSSSNITFANFTRNIFKVHRRLNTIVDALARQAVQHSTFQNSDLEFSCSLEHHMPHCNVLQALQSVGLTGVTILAARCC